MNFGLYIKNLRLGKGFTLREFCKKYGHDASNWSKIERGKNLPPADDSILEQWAQQLGLEKFSSDWYTFIDLAAVARGELPNDLREDENIVAKLTLFYRTLRGQKPTDKEMKNIAKLLKEY
jgi:transcriptional regulator with XRE-family HTH domain